MWKKSGAWFFKGLPNYELPQRCCINQSIVKEYPLKPTEKPPTGIHVDESSSEEDEPDGEDEIIISKHLQKTTNLFALLLSNDKSSKSTSDESSKKSPISAYSRQTRYLH